jgi:hypothetical protein
MSLQVPLSTEEPITSIASFLIHIVLLLGSEIYKIKKINLYRITGVRLTRVTPHRIRELNID